MADYSFKTTDIGPRVMKIRIDNVSCSTAVKFILDITDKKHTPIIDEEVAPNVRRIFEMYASGLSPMRKC